MIEALGNLWTALNSNTAYLVVYWIGSALVPLAAIPSNAIVWQYHRNLPWRRSLIGRVWMRKSVSIAAVLDLAAVGIVLDFFWAREHVLFAALRVAAFAYVTWALWAQRGLMAQIIDEGRTAGDAVQARKDQTPGVG